MSSRLLPATAQREDLIALGRGESRGGDASLGNLLHKPIEEEKPGAKHPINLTSFAAQISKDIRR